MMMQVWLQYMKMEMDIDRSWNPGNLSVEGILGYRTTDLPTSEHLPSIGAMLVVPLLALGSFHLSSSVPIC